MDSDDEIVPECISILHKRILETDADMVVGSYVRKKRIKSLVKIGCMKICLQASRMD